MALSINATQKYMYAASVPLLQEQTLCAFLKEMDVKEVILTERESQELKKGLLGKDEKLKKELSALREEFSWTNLFKWGSFIGFGIGASTGLTRLVYENSLWAGLKFDGWGSLCGARGALLNEASKVKSIGSNFVRQSARVGFIAGASIMGLGLVSYIVLSGSLFSQHQSEKAAYMREYTSEINGNRILRLKDKIREIEKRSLEISNEQDARQLVLARDFFSQKQVEMEVDKTNNLKVEIREYRYV